MSATYMHIGIPVTAKKPGMTYNEGMKLWMSNPDDYDYKIEYLKFADGVHHQGRRNYRAVREKIKRGTVAKRVLQQSLFYSMESGSDIWLLKQTSPPPVRLARYIAMSAFCNSNSEVVPSSG